MSKSFLQITIFQLRIEPDHVELLLSVVADVIIFKIFHRHEAVSLRRAVHDVDDASRSDEVSDVGDRERIVRNQNVEAALLSDVNRNIEPAPEKKKEKQ